MHKAMTGVAEEFQLRMGLTRSVVENWVRDLVILKTFAGLRFHEAILKKAAEIKRTDCRLSEPGDEPKGIDGYIRGIPVSIKPHAYEMKASLPEQINVKMIYYTKIGDGIEVDYGDLL